MVLVDRRDSTLVLTLNRPDRRNAIDLQMSRALSAGLDLAEQDPEIRAVVLTGAGSVFCAGADLRTVASGAHVLPEERRSEGFAGLTRRALPIPVIAALNGPAVGGGAEIALACDMVVASPEASLVFPEVQRGLLPAAGGPLRLPRLLPPGMAAAALLTGRPLEAQRLAEWGVVTEVVATESVVDRACLLAERVAAGTPGAVAATLELMRASVAVPESLWARSETLSAALRRRPGAAEQVQAFFCDERVKQHKFATQAGHAMNVRGVVSDG